MTELIDCAEFSVLEIELDRLVKDGKLALDQRIRDRGYLNAKIRGSDLLLGATKFVGVFPLTEEISVRVLPKTDIGSLSMMIAGSGVAPTAIEGFSRGYMPRLSSATGSSAGLLGQSLADGAHAILRRGLAKRYHSISNPVAWRGRLLPSQTIKKFASRGIKYRHEFDQSILSAAIVENYAIKEALIDVKRRSRISGDTPLERMCNSAIDRLSGVPRWVGSSRDLVVELRDRLRRLPRSLDYYRQPLWESYLILQDSLPEIEHDGIALLDSMIIDVSVVFEGFLRNQLASRLRAYSLIAKDGNKFPVPMFIDNETYKVHPDIIVERDGRPIAVLDAKYKPKPNEKDRYELLAFMEALDVSVGGFICPAFEGSKSRYMGSTGSGRSFFDIRFDLSALDLSEECRKLADAVSGLTARVESG